MRDGKKNKVTVQIYGQKYTVVGKASPEHVEQIAQYVHHKMEEIGEKSPHLDTSRISVLTALNIADEYFRLQEEYNELLQIIEEFSKE